MTNDPMRVAIYARYSTNMQSKASVKDQIRLCRRVCEANNWGDIEIFSDEAASGKTDRRPGFERLRSLVTDGHFDVVVTESLDRLSRDPEHLNGFHKRLKFQGGKIVTADKVENNEIQIALRGMIGSMFLQDLGAKTHRGQEGRVLNGKSAGGRSYGYRVDRQPLPDGTWTTGDLLINDDEAKVIRRIFSAYDQGQSARAIAIALNAEGIPAPSSGKGSGEWTFSTIQGNWKRGTGILNNELYIGMRVWNRQHFVTHPETGKRQARLNPPEDWTRNAVPDLRIIDDDLWTCVKTRQGGIRHTMLTARNESSSNTNPLNGSHRAKYLFSGLLKCGCCTGSYTLMNKTKYGCAAARNKGTCDNRLLIKREDVEARVLEGLKSKLLNPAMLAAFVAEYQREWNRLQRETLSDRSTHETEFKSVTKQIDNMIEAISSGMLHPSMKAKMDTLEARKAELEFKLAEAPEEDPILLHPALAQVYGAKIRALAESLNNEETKVEAIELLRGLVSEVRLHPDEHAPGGHLIELYGELAAILELSGPRNDKTRRVTGGVSVSMVAGVGFEPTTFRL
jgi:site-specific DNA recombinase